MGKFIETILDSYSDIIDKKIDRFAFNDRIYKKDCNSRDHLEKSFFSIEFSDEQRFVEDYIACIQTTDERRTHLAYLAGIRDAIKFLNALGLLKKSKKLKK